jgi:hypothetical protein
MPEIVGDQPDIFQMPPEARDEVYSRTNPGIGEAWFGRGYGGGLIDTLSDIGQRGTSAGASWIDRAMYQATVGAAAANQAPIGYDPSLLEPPPPAETPLMQPADYNEQYAPRDISGKIIPIGDQPMQQGLAKIIGEQKTRQLEREGIWRRFTESHAWPVTMAAGVVGQMLDPGNLALGMIPPFGEGMLAAQLGGSFLARAAARVGAGALSGAAVGAGTAALHMVADPEEASDYGMRQALSDVFYSAAGFAALHGGIGTGLDILRGGIGRYAHTIDGKTYLTDSPIPPTREQVDAGVVRAATPAAPGMPTTDAATQHAIMSSQIGRVIEGKEVNASDFFYQPPSAETAVGLGMRPVGPAEIRAAPDVEAQARQLAPDLFARYDALQQRAAELQGQIRDPEATIGGAIDQQIAGLRSQAEAVRSQMTAPVGATAEEVRAQLAQGTAAYEAATRQADALAAQRPAMIQARVAAARNEFAATDAQLRDIAASGDLARARRVAADIQAAAAASRATVMGPARVLPEVGAAPRADVLREAPRYTTEPDHEVAGQFVAKDSTGKVVAVGASPAEAVQRARLREREPAAVETITQSEFKAAIATAGQDLEAATNQLNARITQALAEGREVTLYADGGKKAVPITAVTRRMMQDAQGQRWGTMELATTRGTRVEISGRPGEAAAAAATPRAPVAIQLPEYARAEFERNWAMAQRLDVFDDIERLSAERKTGAEVARALGSKINRIRDIARANNASERQAVEQFVRQVRSGLGIPSQDQRSEFAAWLAAYRTRGTAAAAPAPRLDVLREGGAAAPAGIPPVKEGFVRFYHGQPPGEGEAPPGPRWVTPDYRYARDFRSTATEPAKVFYIDLPKGHPEEVGMREWTPQDEAEGLNNVGYYHTAELPEDVVTQHGMRPVPAEGAAPRLDVLREGAPAAPPPAAAPPRVVPNLLEMARREQALDREGFAPGMSRAELAAANEAVYGKGAAERAAPTGEAAPGAERAGVTPEETLLEEQIARIPPEALHPDDRAELEKANEDIAAAQTTLRSAINEAASCLIGLVV